MAYNRSTENLIEEFESISSSEHENAINNDNVQTVEVDIHGSESKRYILNKFLNDASSIHEKSDNSVDSNATFVKPPIPKPRKTKVTVKNSTSKSESNSTYHEKKGDVNTQENLACNIDDEIQSNRTYSVKSERESRSEKSSISRSKTFIIKEKVGDSTKENEQIELKSLGKDVNATDGLPDNTTNLEYIDEKRPKPRKRRLIKEQSQELAENPNVVEETKIDIPYKYDKIMGIIIHQTDRLEINSFVIHPVVKIHMINSETGEYLTKSDKNRSVVFYYEDKKYSYIVPVLTHAFNLQEQRSLLPKWEETVVINEDFNYILEQKNNTLILFQIVDFMSFANTNLTMSKSSNVGWHEIAWAFLKPVGKNNVLNVNHKVRLQLYKPGKIAKLKRSGRHCEIYDWWKEAKWKKYPATLYVTVKEMISPDGVIDSLRSKTPIQAERASKRFANLEEGIVEKEDASTSEKIEDMKKLVSKNNWSKLLSNICKLPNSEVTKLPSYSEGCYSLKFSYDGQFLACCVLIDTIYNILVYELENFKEVCRFPGHQQLVYEINWSFNDKNIISASADGTVCIWGLEKSNFIQMLPHPTYVYTSSISSEGIIATGGYDCIMRIWVNDADDKNEYKLKQEMDAHKGYITSSCFNKDSVLLYTSDSGGVILEWENQNEWILKREINLIDFKDTIIDKIILNRKEKRLLIHAKDSMASILDLKSLLIMFCFRSLTNKRHKTSCCYSHCGSYIFLCSEDGYVNIYASNKEDLVGRYQPFGANIPVHAIDFNPCKNTIVFAHYGYQLPILIYDYNEKPNINILELKINEKEYISKMIQNMQELNMKKSEKSSEPKGSTLNRQNSVYFKNILEKLDKIILPG